MQAVLDIFCLIMIENNTKDDILRTAGVPFHGDFEQQYKSEITTFIRNNSSSNYVRRYVVTNAEGIIALRRCVVTY